MALEKTGEVEQELWAKNIVDAAYQVHRQLGPGLLEKIYESCLAYELSERGLDVQRQVSVPVIYKDIEFNEGFRIDLLVENQIIIELKASEQATPLWQAQLLSYMKLTNRKRGFLINFNTPLIKNGIQRYRL